jgi:hypothetical protein
MADTHRPTFIFRLSKECVVDIQLSGEVSQEAIEKLIEVLHLVKECYPDERETSDAKEARTC